MKYLLKPGKRLEKKIEIKIVINRKAKSIITINRNREI